jgi:hypothetical protein
VEDLIIIFIIFIAGHYFVLGVYSLPAESVRNICSVIPLSSLVVGSGGGSAGESFGSCADLTMPPHWTEPSARLFTK